jgi:hypothetical protein
MLATKILTLASLGAANASVLRLRAVPPLADNELQVGRMQTLDEVGQV